VNTNKLLLIALLSASFAAQADVREYYQRQRAVEYSQAYDRSVQEELHEANRLERARQRDEDYRYLLDSYDRRARETECQFGPDVFGGSCQ
jgi:Zn-dependent membrane protease YugP